MLFVDCAAACVSGAVSSRNARGSWCARAWVGLGLIGQGSWDPGSHHGTAHRASSTEHQCTEHQAPSIKHQCIEHQCISASSIRRSGVGIRSPTDAPQDQGNIKNRCMPYAHNLSHPPRKEKNQNEKNRMEWNGTEQSRADSAKTRRFGARSLAGARAQPEI